MNHIVVPTDFSQNAQTALNFAINIANHFGARIHLIHSYEVRSRAGMMISLRDFMLKDAEESLSKEVKRVKSSLLHHTELTAKAIEGHPVDNTCAYAEQWKADLIVMGTKGASGLKKIFLGSVTAGMIDKANNPVMAIPDEITYRPFKEITLAIDTSDLKAVESMSSLTDLIRAYKSNLRILHVEEPQDGARQAPELYAPPVPHAFYTIENDSVLEGIDQFVEQYPTDLLVMIHNDQSFFGRIFYKSRSKEKAMDTTLPLLILSQS